MPVSVITRLFNCLANGDQYYYAILMSGSKLARKRRHERVTWRRTAWRNVTYDLLLESCCMAAILLSYGAPLAAWQLGVCSVDDVSAIADPSSPLNAWNPSRWWNSRALPLPQVLPTVLHARITQICPSSPDYSSIYVLLRFVLQFRIHQR